MLTPQENTRPCCAENHAVQQRAESKEQFWQLTRKKLKDAIRPYYQAIVKRQPDKQSALAIDSIDGYEIAYRKGTADQTTFGYSFDNDVFFPGVPEYQPGHGDVIIEIGSHIGAFALLASSKVGGNGRVHAIEASQDTFNFLKINVALNHCANVSPHHLAIANQEGACKLYHSSSGNWGHSIVKSRSKSHETVTCRTLASFFSHNQINTCHFMKLNCEGAEFPILLNTPRNVLARIKTILVLYHCDLWAEHRETDLLAHLQAGGFECTTRNCSQTRGWIVGVHKGL